MVYTCLMRDTKPKISKPYISRRRGARPLSDREIFGLVLKDRTAEAFSAYAGYPVQTYYLSDFPHWDKLARRETLSEQELQERSDALLKTLERNRYEGALKNEVKKVASWNNASVSSVASSVPVHRPLIYALNKTQRPSDNSLLLSSIVKPGQSSKAYGKNVVLSLGNDLPVSARVCFRYQAFVLLYKQGDDPKIRWNTWVGVPKDRLFHGTDNQDVHFLDAFHEMRHTRQAALSKTTFLSNFLIELDADRFALAAHALCRLPKETRTSYRHGRYMNCLTSPSQYWFAPTLDAVDSRMHPPSAQDVFSSVLDMRLAIIDSIKGEIPWHNTREAVAAAMGFPGVGHVGLLRRYDVAEKDKEFNAWKDRTQKPEIMYTVLRELVEKRAFDHPLTQQIASKVVAAAEYFNPDLTREPNPRAKATLPIMTP